jgi:hypothetical protein
MGYAAVSIGKKLTGVSDLLPPKRQKIFASGEVVKSQIT